MTKEIMKVQDLTKFFPVTAGILRHIVGYVQAVNGVGFTIHKKEVLGLVGESGSGKTTVGRAAIRLIEPTKGKISFLGKDLLALNPQELLEMRTKMQMIFQDPYSSLNPRKTIGDTLGEPLRYHGMVKNKVEEVDRVAEILNMIGLSPDIMRRYPHQFSGGQQQRICIGRAIALNPELIVCDEPLSALDVSVQAQILNLLLDLRNRLGLSYLFISHDLSIIRHISDKVIVLYLGKIMESASTKELFRNPKHPYTRALLSAMPKTHPLQKMDRMQLKGEIPSALNPPSGCPFRTRCPFAQPICAETPPVKVIQDPDTGAFDHVYHCILD